MLYLGMSVLLLVDSTYQGRFWTNFEAFLAMHEATAEGLRPAKACRYTIMLVLGANQDMARALENKWRALDTREAHEALAKDDIEVTNKSDKDEQLDKLLKLDNEIRDAFGAA